MIPNGLLISCARFPASLPISCSLLVQKDFFCLVIISTLFEISRSDLCLAGLRPPLQGLVVFATLNSWPT